jgi:DNA-binding transcriptional ArsR family regulator
MSPLTNNSPSWDPNSLRLDRVGRSQGGTRHGRRVSPVTGKFIAGPIPVSWICRAKHLGVTALLVGLALWHIKGLRKVDTFIVSNLMLEGWGIQPDAKSRALRKLERAGLITVERRGKRSPQVTLLVEDFPKLQGSTATLRKEWCGIQHRAELNLLEGMPTLRATRRRMPKPQMPSGRGSRP